jgi:serine/threonine-protein kinase
VTSTDDLGLLAERYALVSELGRGGVGVVYCARDERLGRDVAIKLLHPWIAQEDEAVARFRREALTLAQLAHPHIVRLYDFDDRGDRAFIVMELVDGERLDASPHDQPLDQETAYRLLRPVASALAYAHERGIVHRDLKPGNILVDRDGRVVVSDFGLARLAQGMHSITTSGVLVGSPEYWAPEQASGSAVTPASDMYALGCILFQLLTGRLPFEGEDRLAVGYRRVHEDAPSIGAVRAGIPREAAELVDALLARDPALRPTAAELVERLTPPPAAEIAPTAVEQEQTTLVDVPTPPQGHVQPRRRRPVGALLLLGALGLAALGVAAGLVLRGGDDRTASRSASTGVVTVTTEGRVETVLVTTTAPAPSTPTTTAATTAAQSPPAAPGGFETFDGEYFDVGYPAGWVVEAAEVSKGSYIDTTIRNPEARGELVRVDMSPGSGSDPLRNALGVERGLTRQAGYRRLALERTTLNGHDAVWWEFNVSEGGTLLHKVDLFLTDAAGNSFAILTQSTEDAWQERQATFEQVRASFRPRG